ncbi:uncharacterized protein LOC141910653 isoform X2 [Tubulanus polymorphus]|uniref:uncharacterized protein LOC141910653 isoform X2 n=1 Tax=Tubulanus polymorphus TaxID=672921 RepID=UPI003DA355E4
MASRQVDDEAFVTLATNDTYCIGALVLANSLRLTNTRRKLVVLISKEVTSPVRQQLSNVFDLVKEVDILDSRDTVNLALLTRTNLGVTFTKLHCWRLTQFTKCVFLDADTLVLQNVDELFDREELSAAPDAGWPDCFNSGVFVFRPSEETYQALLQCALSQGSFDGGDQGLLNLFFSDWPVKDISKHLPFIYNVVSQAFYSYLPAFKQFRDKIKICHFIGAVKPWAHYFNTRTGEVEPQQGSGHDKDFLQIWWMIFMTHVQPNLDPSTEAPNTRTTAAPPITHMLYPYCLPAVETFYELVAPPGGENNNRENDDENAAVAAERLEFWENREYEFFESHYVEPPMSQIDIDEPLPVIFDPTRFEDLSTANEKREREESRRRREEEEAERERRRKEEEQEERERRREEERNKQQDGEIGNGDERVNVDRDNNNENTQNQKQPVLNNDRSVLTTNAQSDVESTDDIPVIISCTVAPPAADRYNYCPFNRNSDEPCTCSYRSNNNHRVVAEHGLIGQLASLTLASEHREHAENPYGNEREWQYAWERGQIDYMGCDAFDHIQRKIQETLHATKQTAKPGGAKKPASGGAKPKTTTTPPPPKAKSPPKQKSVSKS